MTFAARVVPLIVAVMLAGCSAAIKQRIADCQVGDWQQIGRKDGLDGAPPNFAERKDFCDDHADSGKSAAADAGARYTAGWELGNTQMWTAVGVADGARGMAQQFAARAAGEEVRQRKTPPNQRAYDDGWLRGNAQYWEGIGKRDGVAGRPLTGKDASRSQADQTGIRFDDAAYDSGWQAGNRQFWQDAGASDASNGVPDSALRERAASARSAGVQVQEDVYRAAWNGEIVNYWRNLGARDAVTGSEFGVRGREARQKGLKVFEAEYRQAWEKRLTEHWEQAGREDGYGKPFLLEERIANARRDGVFAIPDTRAIYTRAWEAENARYCVPENAFEQGRLNRGLAFEVCQPPLRDRLRSAWFNGQEFASAELRQRQVVEDVRQLEARLYEGRRRLDRLDRDVRNSQPTKDKPATDESDRQNRRREQDRRDLADQLRRLERQLDDAHLWLDQNDFSMQRLRRDIY
ncbi:hypothetical protein ASF61_20735 [Duganella sp. Leaf126]|uniref:hypothetical protein n=1 Tax=Duganella sp. Leaf126 TaxID=1736266 RepID=UPI0006F69547|nr:hypothetical protein [Duganella sp. Leaf126]KQQ45136.1 hypothetical protein ASF61_20735 [Duganella sp. Leaf126]